VTAGSAVAGASLDVATGGIAWGDVSKAGSRLNDLTTISTSKPVTVTDIQVDDMLSVDGGITGPGAARISFVDDSVPILEVNVGAGQLAMGDIYGADSENRIIVDGTGVSFEAQKVTVKGAQLDINNWLNWSARPSVTMAAGSTITPGGTYQQLTSASAVSTSTSTAIANGAEAGDLLLLRNANAVDAITVDGTGANVECKTDKALGPGDTLMLIWNGADWNCLSLADNS
jgi:hypothetical protein